MNPSNNFSPLIEDPKLRTVFVDMNRGKVFSMGKNALGEKIASPMREPLEGQVVGVEIVRDSEFATWKGSSKSTLYFNLAPEDGKEQRLAFPISGAPSEQSIDVAGIRKMLQITGSEVDKDQVTSFPTEEMRMLACLANADMTRPLDLTMVELAGGKTRMMVSQDGFEVEPFCKRSEIQGVQLPEQCAVQSESGQRFELEGFMGDVQDDLVKKMTYFLSEKLSLNIEASKESLAVVDEEGNSSPENLRERAR